jgi:hypothetical protein|tara:strand:- start:563 stop:928 length:366 start_codon:yes stop_codon:yes gene_type:complete
MVLVDTSVWIDHFRTDDEYLVSLLNTVQVLAHPFIIGELACGNLQNRDELLVLLQGLPQVTVALDREVLMFIEEHKLMGQGIGYIDAHLLVAVALSRPIRLWTRDRSLARMATDLDLHMRR